ncbi:hypothetical protein EDB19DRAFT_1829482 [Suillus lakei]|nr:hypothetical protein EDB19DRAFT_1829482 [Suillus lakei]
MNLKLISDLLASSNCTRKLLFLVQDIKPHGYTTHCKACEKKAEKQWQNQHFVDSIQRNTGPLNLQWTMGDHIDSDTASRQGGTWNDLDDVEYHEHPLFLDTDVPKCMGLMFQVDDIKLEYHPSSRITPEIYAFNEFKCCPPMSSAPPDKCPWAPFKCTSQLEKFMFKSHKDIHERWDAVSHHTTGFTHDVISVPYDDSMQQFELYYCDLWEWAADLLCDPWLFPHMVFDAQHFSKFDGKTFICFIDKPFTAESFWNIQSQLPPGGKPLAFILYADKTRLSLFGTTRGYPVVERLANLPVDIRNGQGVGSGYVVGWLPIVKEDRDHASKPSWVNFKNTIWHESFSKILSSLTSKSYTGQWFECPANILQWFFPIILILSADYKEQDQMPLAMSATQSQEVVKAA